MSDPYGDALSRVRRRFAVAVANIGRRGERITPDAVAAEMDKLRALESGADAAPLFGRPTGRSFEARQARAIQYALAKQRDQRLGGGLPDRRPTSPPSPPAPPSAPGGSAA